MHLRRLRHIEQRQKRLVRDTDVHELGRVLLIDNAREAVEDVGQDGAAGD